MAVDHRPQVELIAVVATCEAVPGLLFKMDAECSSRRGGTFRQGACATQLRSLDAGWLPGQQGQNVVHRYQRTDLCEVDQLSRSVVHRSVGRGFWLRCFARSLGSVTATGDLQYDGSVDDAVQKCHREWRVAEVIGPGVEVDVGGQRCRASAVAGVDHLKQQVRSLRRFRAFDVVEAEFVDDQQVESRPVPQTFRQRLICQTRGEIGQQVGTGCISYAQTLRTEAAAHRLQETAFSHAALTHHDQVLVTTDEFAAGQFFDLNAVDGFGVELPVELFERLRFLEACVADATFDAAFPASSGLFSDQQTEEFEM